MIWCDDDDRLLKLLFSHTEEKIYQATETQHKQNLAI